jgi:hypothetical protein
LLFFTANLNFPNEYNDCEAGKLENKRIKEELLQKYIAKPASKRVNYLNNGFLNPFYCPLNSIVGTNSQNEDKSYFILRNMKLLTKLKNYFYNFNNKKIVSEVIFAELRNCVDNFDEILERSYINVRLTAFEKGTVASYSQIYALNDTDLNMKELKIDENIDLKSFKKAIKDSQEKFVDKNELYSLIDENSFQTFQDEMNKTSSRKLVGFVINSKFTLVNGQCSANATITTKSIIEMILKQQNNAKFRNIVFYRTPTSLQYSLAKINYFYI